MALSIDDFLTAAMLYPGATNFSIKKDKSSGVEFIEADADLFDTRNIEWKNDRSKKSLKARKALRAALEAQFGHKVANFACPPNDQHLDAPAITHLIKIAESTASKNNILREECILSEKFILSTEYIGQLRLAGDQHDAFYQSEYKKIIKTLDDYENEVAYLSMAEKLKRLAKIEVEATLMLEKQEAFAAHSAENDRKNIQRQCEVTSLLIKGIQDEKRMMAAVEG